MRSEAPASRLLGLRLTPLGARRLALFRANRRGRWSLWVFAVLFVVSLGAMLRHPLTLIPENWLKFGVGAILSAFGVFWFAGSAIMGWLYDTSVPALVVFSLVLSLAALPVFYLAKRAPEPSVLAGLLGGHEALPVPRISAIPPPAVNAPAAVPLASIAVPQGAGTGTVVAAGLAARAQVQVAYAIGVAEPVSIMVETFGTGKVPTVKLEQMIRQHFDFTPAGIIKYLNLRRPIYKQTAAYGHFGRSEPEFTWERTDRVKDLRADAGI